MDTSMDIQHHIEGWAWIMHTEVQLTTRTQTGWTVGVSCTPACWSELDWRKYSLDWCLCVYVCMCVYCRIGFLKDKSLSMHNHPSHKINTFQIIHHQLLCFHSCIYPTTAQFPHKIVLSELLLNQVHQTPKTFFL